jgi:hypothetical protein
MDICVERLRKTIRILRITHYRGDIPTQHLQNIKLGRCHCTRLLAGVILPKRLSYRVRNRNGACRRRGHV